MKRRSLRPLFLPALVVSLAIGGTACLVTQPVLTGPRSTSSVDDGASARLEADVRGLTSITRDFDHPSGLEQALELVRDRFASSGLHAEEQRYEVRGILAGNVIAHVGSDSGPRVVIGAHYDTCGAHPGADDNASGVAGLLELARRFAAHPPEGRVDLVAYTLEEPPSYATEHMGSFVHASSLKKDGVEVKAMISLEMIGTFSDAPGSQRFPSSLVGALYPDRGDFIAVVGDFGQIGLTRATKRSMLAASPLPVRSINAPRSLPGIDFSDHRSYWAHDYPAVMVTDTAFFRNDRYHTDGDTPDRLDYRRMAQVVDGVEGAVRTLASN